MKKSLIIVLLFSLILSFSTTNASALRSAVYFEGGAENFVFYPGSNWNDTDLFDGFKDAMPGDTLQEEVSVRNFATEYDKIKIYLRAEPHNDTLTADFLAQLSMKVWNGGELIYNATADQADGLKNNVLLGIFSAGEQTTLNIELTIPKSLDSRYAHRTGEIDWIFTAETINQSAPEDLPHTTPLTLDQIFLFVGIFAIAAIGFVVTVVTIRRQLKKSKKEPKEQ